MRTLQIALCTLFLCATCSLSAQQKEPPTYKLTLDNILEVAEQIKTDNVYGIFIDDREITLFLSGLLQPVLTTPSQSSPEPVFEGVDDELNATFSWDFDGSPQPVQVSTLSLSTGTVTDFGVQTGANSFRAPYLIEYTLYAFYTKYPDRYSEVDLIIIDKDALRPFVVTLNDQTPSILRSSSQSTRTFPNPTTDELRLQFEQQVDGEVSLSVFQQSSGRLMARPFQNTLLPKGPQELRFSLAEWPAGMYRLLLQTPSEREQLVVLKVQ
ncbi:MAG: hypothetical protein AAFV95_09020 [Bacteroidota bacterium]